jgi:hypothetical protein
MAPVGFVGTDATAASSALPIGRDVQRISTEDEIRTIRTPQSAQMSTEFRHIRATLTTTPEMFGRKQVIPPVFFLN